jgi:ribonucleoside-diphosphate reductase alpha chain
MIDLELPYGSEEMLEETNAIFEFIKVESYLASANIAEEKGSFEYYDEEKFLQSGFMATMPQHVIEVIKQKGIRNVCSLTVAPTGSTGTMVGVATGLEPYFSFTYYRSGRLGKFIEVRTAIAEKFFAENPDATELPKWYVSSMQIGPLDHAKVQSVIQQHIDSAISKTCNAPRDFTVEQNKELYLAAWKGGCKGVTVYVDGSRDKQVLSVEAVENVFIAEAIGDAIEVLEEARELVAVGSHVNPTDDMLTGDTRVCEIKFDESGNMIKECH